jgi:hypothetical protein
LHIHWQLASLAGSLAFSCTAMLSKVRCLASVGIVRANKAGLMHPPLLGIGALAAGPDRLPAPSLLGAANGRRQINLCPGISER